MQVQVIGWTSARVRPTDHDNDGIMSFP